MRRVLVLLLLAACAPANVAEDLATITVSSGGFLGQSTTTIRADDRVEEHFVGMGRPDTLQVVPGAYARAAEVIRTEGPETLARADHGPEVCMDYGTDLVRIEPATETFHSVMVDCPDEAVTALMAHVLAATAAPQ